MRIKAQMAITDTSHASLCFVVALILLESIFTNEKLIEWESQSHRRLCSFPHALRSPSFLSVTSFICFLITVFLFFLICFYVLHKDTVSPSHMDRWKLIMWGDFSKKRSRLELDGDVHRPYSLVAYSGLYVCRKTGSMAGAVELFLSLRCCDKRLDHR